MIVNKKIEEQRCTANLLNYELQWLKKNRGR